MFNTITRSGHSRARRLAALLLIAAGAAAFLPTSASAFQKAIWGPSYRHGKNEFALYHAMGVKLYETDVDWAAVAPKKPTSPADPKSKGYHWPKYLSEEIALAKKYKMSVMIQVKGSPSWANGGHHDGSGVTGLEWAPTNASSYSTFVKAVATKYPSVHLWMVWGEPDRAGDFMPWVTDSGIISNTQIVTADHRYAQMLNDSYGVLKKLSGKNLVIGGNTWTRGEISPQQWMENMKLPDGKRPRLDMWGHNPFSYASPTFYTLSSLEKNGLFDGEVQYQDLPLMEHWTKKYFGRSIKLFLSEWNVETELDDTFGGGYLQSESTAASWVKQALRESAKTKWIYALGWINVYDSAAQKVCQSQGRHQYCYDERTTGTGLFYSNGKPKPDETSWKNYG